MSKGSRQLRSAGSSPVPTTTIATVVKGGAGGLTGAGEDINEKLDSMLKAITDRCDKTHDFMIEMDKKRTQEITGLKLEIDSIKEQMIGMQGKIVPAIKGLAMKIDQTEEDIKEVKQEMDVIKGKVEKFDGFERDLLLSQAREMEFALRIRGLKENDRQKLLETLAEAFAPVLEMNAEDVAEDIDKFYRVNSVVARRRNLPRDIVVYFTNRKVRNEIIQAFFKEKFQIDGQDILILKELPSKILRKRKDYAFLTDALKRQSVLFRWELPEGLIFTYLDRRYRIDSVYKAKQFFDEVLMGDATIFSDTLEPKESTVLKDTPTAGAKRVEARKVLDDALYSEKVKEGLPQREVRAVVSEKRKQQEQISTQLLETAKMTAEARSVGTGAIPKRKSAMEQVLLDLEGQGDGC